METTDSLEPSDSVLSRKDIAFMSAESGSTPLEDFESEALPYWSDLYRTALRLLQQPARASDAVQEAYLLAWRSFDRYQRGTNCKAWLFRILFNVVRHERRSWFKWITGTEGDVSECETAAPPLVSETLRDDSILDALDALPVPFREVVLLVDVQEFSYKEAGEILKVPVGTVMSRLSRGRTLLRERLTPIAASYGIRTRTSLAPASAAGRS